MRSMLEVKNHSVSRIENEPGNLICMYGMLNPMSVLKQTQAV